MKTWLVSFVVGALVGAGVTMLLIDRSSTVSPSTESSSTESSSTESSSTESVGSASRDSLQARIDELVRENEALRERLDTPAGEEPTLAGQGDPGIGTGAGKATQPPAPVPGTKGAPAKGPPEDGTAAKGLAGLDWKKWVPVLIQYGALDIAQEPSAELRKDLSAFLGEVNERLQGQKWETATDLFRAPALASEIALAAAEHAGAKLTPERRAALAKALETSVREDLTPKTKSPLGIERMAAVLQAIANAHALLAKATDAEQAAAAIALLNKLLSAPGWDNMYFGSVGYEEFQSVALQLWQTRATLDDHERSEASLLVKDWWEKSRVAIADATRAHGEAAVLASLREKAGDDDAMARARQEPGFAGVRSALHAKLAGLQAAAERAFFGLWEQVPKERQKAFDDIEPVLLLFVPR